MKSVENGGQLYTSVLEGKQKHLILDMILGVKDR